MTTMIRKSRAIIAASILTAVIMSFPATTSEAMVQRDATRAVSSRICPIDWRQSAWHVKQLIRCAASYHGVSERKALYIAWRESRYRPSAYNAGGNAAGIYQHLLKYWPTPSGGLRLPRLVRVQRSSQHLRDDADGEALQLGTLGRLSAGAIHDRTARAAERTQELPHVIA